jgi:hypothetical protein
MIEWIHDDPQPWLGQTELEQTGTSLAKILLISAATLFVGFVGGSYFAGKDCLRTRKGVACGTFPPDRCGDFPADLEV